MSKLLLKLGSAILPGVFNIVDQAVKDKDLAAKLKHDLQMAALEGTLTDTKTARDVIVAEAQGQSPMQRNWRPITMLTFVFIIANNYIFVPYAQAFGLEIPALEIPNGMWALLNVGIGGYIASRGWEKVVETKAASKQ
jgi:hypothetical protein